MSVPKNLAVLVLTGILLVCIDLSSAGDKPQNAYKGDVNACLFQEWTKSHDPNTAVLDTTVTCDTFGSHYKELCYGLNHNAQAQFAVCYDEDKLIPSFTGHILNPGGASAGTRPDFKADTGLHKPKYQAAVDDYKVYYQDIDYGFDLSSNHYCAKGHLVPNADYDSAHEAQAALTFILTNAAPQWQKFNGGNWMLLEKDVRSYVNDVDRKVYIFTGTGGVAEDPYGAPYLMNGKVYSPQYYWKLICDPVIKEMIIFVGTNPVASRVLTKHQGCNGQMHTEERGVMQCDSYDDVKNNPLYSDFKLPKMYNTNCPTGTRGTFMDPYINNFG